MSEWINSKWMFFGLGVLGVVLVLHITGYDNKPNDTPTPPEKAHTTQVSPPVEPVVAEVESKREQEIEQTVRDAEMAIRAMHTIPTTTQPKVEPRITAPVIHDPIPVRYEAVPDPEMSDQYAAQGREEPKVKVVEIRRFDKVVCIDTESVYINIAKKAQLWHERGRRAVNPATEPEFFYTEDFWRFVPSVYYAQRYAYDVNKGDTLVDETCTTCEYATKYKGIKLIHGYGSKNQKNCYTQNDVMIEKPKTHHGTRHVIKKDPDNRV